MSIIRASTAVDAEAARRIVELFDGRIRRHQGAIDRLQEEVFVLREFIAAARQAELERRDVVSRRWKLRRESRAFRREASVLQSVRQRSEVSTLRWAPALKADKQVALRAIEREAARADRYQPLAGIYFLISGKEVVYVGQSIDCHVRIRTHFQREMIKFERVCVIPTRRQDLDAREKLFIELLNPKMNRTFNRAAFDRQEHRFAVGAS